jgi:signal transduction histidine kinase
VNVVENALKFSPVERPVDVLIAPSEGGVEIAVSDQGPGVAADDAERIFEPFARSDRTAEAAGSGLGLAIARGLARANGGELRVADPVDGRGATFSLSLPAGGG